MERENILTDEQKAAGFWLVRFEEMVMLMCGKKQVVSFAPETPDWWIRRMADLHLESKNAERKLVYQRVASAITRKQT